MGNLGKAWRPFNKGTESENNATARNENMNVVSHIYGYLFMDLISIAWARTSR